MSKPEEENLNDIIKNKFFSPASFSEEIEKIVASECGMNYVDAICHFCEENNLDIESVPKLISKPLKERIKAECLQNNLLKTPASKAKLPL